MALGRSLFFALAIHAGVAVAGRWAAGPDSAVVAAPTKILEVSVVELAALRAPGRPNGGGPAMTAATAPPVAVGRRRPSAGAPTVPREPGADSSDGRVAMAEGSERTRARAAPAPPTPAVDLGLWRSWVAPPLDDRPRSEWQSGAHSAGGLGQGLAERDRARGLGRGGVVATLARSATLSAGPRVGEATLLVTTDGDGRVVNVSLGEAVGAGWAGVARSLERALAAKRLRVPHGSKGLSVRVQVSCKVQLPSGADPDRPARIRGPGAEFDVADIGARAVRVVSAQITGERLL